MVINCKRYEPVGLEEANEYELVKMIFQMSDVMYPEENSSPECPGTDVYFYNGWCRTIAIDFIIFSKWFRDFHEKPKFSFTDN